MKIDMEDYKVVKKFKGWIVREVWFTFFGYNVYKDLQVPYVSDGRFVRFINTYKPYFDSYETAILTAEFIKEHQAKKYLGFELAPIYEIEDGIVNIDTKLYALMPDSWCKVGTYLELTSLLDDHFGNSN